MATTVPMGTITDVTLGAASAVETLTLPVGARWLVLFASDVDVYVITASGGTASNSGRLIPQTTIDAGGWQYDISSYGFVGLAGSAAGTVRVEIR